MKNRDLIFEKYGGKCAYTGTALKSDWQVDHLVPQRGNGDNSFENLVPAQRIVNHYKGSLTLEEFRTWRLGTLHEKLKRLPKNPKSKKLIRYKAYMLEVAELFGITAENPFSGRFYFESL